MDAIVRSEQGVGRFVRRHENRVSCDTSLTEEEERRRRETSERIAILRKKFQRGEIAGERWAVDKRDAEERALTNRRCLKFP